MTRRGFSLIEVAVSIAMVGIVVTVAASVMVHLNRSLRIQSARMVADEEAKLVAEWLVFELRGLGGDALRPWEGVAVHSGADATACAAVDDVPACDDSDRLLVTIVDPTLGSCSLTGSNGANLLARLADAPPLGDGNGILSSPQDACCLDVLAGAVAGTSPWQNINAIAIDSARGVHPVKLQNRTSSGGENCAINVPGGLPTLPTGVTFDGGSLISATQRLYFRSPVDDATKGLRRNALYEFSDANFDGLFDAGELVLIADNVLDLQVALGHDRDNDGHVVEQSTTSDEWQGNASGDVLPGTVSADSLRMIGVGVMVATLVPLGEAPTSAQLFDGPLRTVNGAQVRATITRAFMRNIFLFD
jgi:prepilin-type N-terminal cleavage/methylation domain-containing protein